ncbi:hypothetical protein P152DRAFT_430755 [Eremomyces bilateralis CBS 781.70]|uniref:Glucosidase 2 subunit beta n=1 Tax=Eremomyces bilateralis CBS 781.70 TaxID=1392243 RepID=A0A6G1G9T3_9PEZI|nr:uncharacterized protein P152DRAFT_430755 [Eremomyces bilateralis CBS 781.70]KAF1814784.1 hypothetical protein P152DRAFT_430755 [Eremomyces bilateralis CBS 781.70]
MRESILTRLVYTSIIYGGIAFSADAQRPRGVGPEFAKFYKTTDTFACISNPSIILPIASLNDDYCDCPDGSDEPGTSACAHISPLSPPSPVDNTLNNKLALPGFYCKNKGHNPGYVPFTAVNDGVCDYDLCCNGSDEWQGVGGIKCEDKCKEIGKEWRKHDEERKRALGAASKRRAELVKEAGRLRKEMEDRLQSLQTEIQGSEIKVHNLEKEVAEVERAEKGKLVKGPAGGGKLSVLGGLAKQRIEELLKNVDRVKNERDDARRRLAGLEELLTSFKEEYNPNFNDEGVKRAVRAWEDYIAQGKAPDLNNALEQDLEQIMKPDAENGLNWEEFQDADESDVEVLYNFEQYLPKPLREWLNQKLRDLRVFLIENGILANPHSDASESAAVTKAKQSLEAAKSALRREQDELKSHQDDLAKEYGLDDIFRALKGQCISTDSGEYTYELCWLDRTTQKPKKGGANVGMGNFVRVDTVMVDEELPPNGKGLGSGERIALRYENGQFCWNGPNRSTLVVLACAEKDEVWKITEEEKCVYRMEVGTPAACQPQGTAKGVREKDEL